MANPFVHVELTTGDLAAAKKFYKSIFGWKLSEMPLPGGEKYTLIDVGGGTGGGMQSKPTPDAPTAWLAYVHVDDVKKTVEKARKNGAQIIMDYQEVMDAGALAIIMDPTGAVLGLWQSFMKAAATRPVARKAASKKKAPARKDPARKKAVSSKKARR